MADTYISYTANGILDTFAVPFSYIAQSHVKVYLDGSLQTVTTHYSFPTSGSIQFVSTPTNGQVVLIKRVTPSTAPLVTHTDGPRILAKDLNNNNKQNIYVTEEAKDYLDDQVTAAEAAQAAAEAAQAAAETAQTAAELAETNAETAQAAAETAETNAAASETAAAASASGASTSATAASASASAASTSATAAASAQTAAETAQTAAETAQTAAEAAQTAAETAQTAAETAQTAAETAETNAGTSETNAAASASAASTSATNAASSATAAAASASAAATSAAAAAAAVAALDGGTTGQVLTKNSATDQDYSWQTISITESQISDLQSYLLDITGESLSDLSDVTITTIAAGELLAWSGTAWVNQTLAEAGIAAASHSHATSDITSGTMADARIAESNVTQHQAALSITESQISDLQAYITGITAEPLSDLSDVTITTIASGEVLVWNGAAWINQTLAEAGIAAASHSHATSDITSGTMADARIAESNVTQHQAALSITESQISDLGAYLLAITGEPLSDLSDVTITTVAANEVLMWSGTAWINRTLAEAGIAAASHTHTESDITDLGAYIEDITGEPLDDLSNVTITTVASGEVLMYNGSIWINQTLAEAGISATSHNHTLDSLSNTTITSIASGEVLMWNGSAWVNQTLAEAGIAAASHTHTESDITDITKSVVIPVFATGSDCSTGDGKIYIPLPPSLNGWNLTDVWAYVDTAGTTGTMDIQIHNVTDAQDVLSTKLTIDSAEKHSSTAATAAVINTSYDDVDTNDVWRIDIDAVHTTAAKGLLVGMEFSPP